MNESMNLIFPTRMDLSFIQGLNWYMKVIKHSSTPYIIYESFRISCDVEIHHLEYMYTTLIGHIYYQKYSPYIRIFTQFYT